mmetsp:Transcript_10013/g.45805  ORF Transcript_10013/g.45805 Transcript_10013/m.45805 type:complete len:213 (+) Transcript_10013:2328-2966(+)
MRFNTRSRAASCAPPRRSSALSATLNIPAARPLADADGDGPPLPPRPPPFPGGSSASSSRPLAVLIIPTSAPASAASGWSQVASTSSRDPAGTSSKCSPASSRRKSARISSASFLSPVRDAPAAADAFTDVHLGRGRLRRDRGSGWEKRRSDPTSTAVHADIAEAIPHAATRRFWSSVGGWGQRTIKYTFSSSLPAKTSKSDSSSSHRPSQS